jgi:hypothetical protein
VDLLFGILAFQLYFVDGDGLIAARAERSVRYAVSFATFTKAEEAARTTQQPTQE